MGVVSHLEEWGFNGGKEDKKYCQMTSMSYEVGDENVEAEL